MELHIFFTTNDEKKTLLEQVFPSPAIDLVCFIVFEAVLLSDFRVFGYGKLNHNQQSFVPVESLFGHKIIKISGRGDSCVALSDNSHVFSYGSNFFGELGDGTMKKNYKEFRKMVILGDAKIIDIALSHHTLLLPEDGRLFGCGNIM